MREIGESIGGAKLIRERRLLTFFSKCGAYSRAALNRLNTVSKTLLFYHQVSLSTRNPGQNYISEFPEECE